MFKKSLKCLKTDELSPHKDGDNKAYRILEFNRQRPSTGYFSFTGIKHHGQGMHRRICLGLWFQRNKRPQGEEAKLMVSGVATKAASLAFTS